MADKAGIRCQLGCHVGETSILAAAGRHFAFGVDKLVYLEGSFSPFLLAREPVTPPVVFENGGIGGRLPGPGLGIKVRDQVLDELAVRDDTDCEERKDTGGLASSQDIFYFPSGL